MASKCPKCKTVNPAIQRFCGDCGTQLLTSEGLSSSLTKTLPTPVKSFVKGSTFAGRYRVLEELGSKRFIGHAFAIAKIYAGLAEEETALEWLEESFDLLEAGMVRLKVDPSLDSLRSNPRYKTLLKKMRLELDCK